MLTIDELRERFISEVVLGKTVDWYLIKLSSVVGYLKDMHGNERVRELLAEFLSAQEVLNALRPLSCYVDVVADMIGKNPRFRILREYSDIVINVLNSLECSDSKALTTSVRAPTFNIEESENVETKAQRPRKKAFKIKTVVYVSIIMMSVSLIAYLLYILLISSRGITIGFF